MRPEKVPGQGVSLHIPRSAINATVQEDILLSVDYSCHGVPTIEWKYTSNWGVQKIVEWKPGTPANVSQSHRDRVCTFDNGSIQLFSVGVRDSGYYVITVTEHPGSRQFGTIVLRVSEIRYEDLHFVAVFFALLAAVAAYPQLQIKATTPTMMEAEQQAEEEDTGPGQSPHVPLGNRGRNASQKPGSLLRKLVLFYTPAGSDGCYSSPTCTEKQSDRFKDA
ncbi:hypothetical protein A6R68_08939 [Neotoma lepida]|uniref:V-set and transmembrane domain-containing protein 5 n=1 Tax=Neotoma lepida TaxID=56216 RepID=A0A1A6G185_NEOLE|nr:hypothetical protein A6R68_08939 [Neotoma lepida]